MSVPALRDRHEEGEEGWEDERQPNPAPPGTTEAPLPSLEAVKPSSSSVEKLLYGGLLGPLKRAGEASDVKPIPVQTTTPGWQEAAEEVISGPSAQGGDAPAANPVSRVESG